jgi:hypothetical protein
MRPLAFLPCTLVVLAAAAASAADPPIYELRVYVCNAGKLDALNTRFRDHTLRLFEKHGMKNVAYWTPVEGDAASTTLYYILEHASRDAAKASWAAFLADPDWKQVAAQSAAAHGQILASRPASTYLSRADFCPAIGPADPSKVYELRTYVAAEGKFDALLARFRDHTDELFARHGIKSVGYWIPTDEPAAHNTLIYVLQHDSREAADANWKKFRADPEWQAAKAASEQGGPLLAGPPGSVYLKPVDYSPKSPRP